VTQKENRRVKMTKRLLGDSLIELMRDRPISKITIKEICQNADVNRSTFYLYYADAYALFSEIEGELLAQARANLEKIGTDPVSIRYVTELLAYIKENAESFRALLCRQEGIPFQSAFVEAALLKLRQSLPLRCAEPVTGYVYDYLILGSMSVIQRWIESGFDMPCEAMAELIFRLSDRAGAAFA
jgi:AcrR family transcriptional regulator